MIMYPFLLSQLASINCLFLWIFFTFSLVKVLEIAMDGIGWQHPRKQANFLSLPKIHYYMWYGNNASFEIQNRVWLSINKYASLAIFSERKHHSYWCNEMILSFCDLKFNSLKLIEWSSFLFNLDLEDLEFTTYYLPNASKLQHGMQAVQKQAWCTK